VIIMSYTFCCWRGALFLLPLRLILISLLFITLFTYVCCCIRLTMFIFDTFCLTCAWALIVALVPVAVTASVNGTVIAGCFVNG